MIPQPKLVRVSSGVMSGLLLKKATPQYPEDARRAGIQGTVNLQAIVNKHGDISDLRLVSGHPALVEAAMKAVKKWKYKPYILQGEPVDVQTMIQVNFSLADR
jgi:protein TonB